MDDTPAPENTNQAVLPPEPPQRNKRLPLFIGLGLVVVLIAILALVAFWPDSNKPNVADQPKQFQNWLKPASEIKVGDNRYVSACSVLPPSTVQKEFGPLTGNTVVQEHYLDQNVGMDELAARPRCTYNHVSGNGPDVLLETEQQPDADDAAALAFTVSGDDEDIQAEIDRYSSAIASTHTSNKDVTDLVAAFKTSFTYYKAHPYTRSQDEIKDLPKNYILPISKTISGALNDFSYSWVYGNTAYILGHTPNGDDKTKQSYKDYTDQQIVDELAKISTVHKAAMANIKNTSLDQSPAPTILGTTNKYGSTTVLEPCAIMTPDVFTKITGKQQNHDVTRTTAQIDLATDHFTKNGKDLILPKNDCARQAGETVGDNTYATFELEYGKNEQQATSWLSKYYKIDAGDTSLQTNADWAAVFANPVKAGGSPLVVFRVGAYIGHISIYTSADSGDVEATQDQYVTAINELTTSIKQNITQIKN